jgi:hypothetical protein
LIRGLNLPEAVAKCVDSSAPESLRLDVARGALPLAPVERLASLTALLADPSDAVRTAARESWMELPPAFLGDALGDPRLPAPTLDLVAALNADAHELVCRALEHPNVGEKTLRRFAASTDSDILSRIATNQRVLGRHPDLAREVAANPCLHPEERGRLASLYAVEPLAETMGPRPVAAVALPPDLPQELLDDDASADAEATNLYQLVQSMSVAEKIKLATLGSKSARRLLIRDTNKIVASAVIKSPKIREDEVQAIAQDRTVADEIIRIILGRRDWVKSYPIRLALAQNPKTPSPKALRLLETLQDRDLRGIAKSRNVASAVAAGAVRILARRGKS